MKKALVLSFIISAVASAATYDYSVDMRDSDGKVTHMGDIRVNVTEEGQNSNGEQEEIYPHHVHHIQNHIKNSFHDYNINIRYADGVVTLNGTVGSEDDKRKIDSEVMKMEGVKKVENNLSVEKK